MENVQAAKKRSEINDRFKWALTDMYASDGDWEKDFTYVKEHLHDMDQYKGTLNQGSKQLQAALETQDTLSLKMEQLYVYSHMKMDEDNSVSKYQGMNDRAQALSVELSAGQAFLDPEILSLDDTTIERYIQENPGLAPYDFGLRALMRLKAHILDEKSEELLAMTHEMSGAPKTIFTMLNNVDLHFPNVKDDEGNTIQLTHGRYGDLMQSKNRTVRKQTYEAMYQEYQSKKTTIAAALNGSVKAGQFYTKARRYPSTLEASLDSDNVPLTVYNNLIQTIHDGLPALQEYFMLKAKALGLPKLAMYDVYAPIAKESKEKIPYEDAQDILVRGLAPLGSEYQQLLKSAFEDHWMDVYENTGKTSGAYSWGAFGTHPYVLLNYQDNLESVFTIAHELGHAMHSHFSDTNQPYSKAQYTIFVAEVASTVNEVLLNYHLLETTKDKAKRIVILNHFLEQFRTTLYRQAMFAEFEQIIHQSAMDGQPLTADYFCEVYGKLNGTFHSQVECDEQISYEWARIPHFYNAFYVYKYATGFSAAVAIAKGILSGKGTEGYLKMLKSGGSDYPIELLKLAGVDMNTTKPIEDCLQVFREMLDLLKQTLNEEA